jgi:pimeloyl-ACP methyl ester carboxylesterase
VANTAFAYTTARGRTAVVLIGGLRGNYQSTTQGYGKLSANLLSTDLGYTPDDVMVWSYDPATWNYDSSLTCRILGDTASALADTLRWLRDGQGYANVVVVGHSLGGDIAYEMVDPRFEFVDQGFLRAIVTIDSPLLGVDSGRAFLARFAMGSCPVVHQLESINQRFVSGLIHFPSPRGVSVLSIANYADIFVPFVSQIANGWVGEHWDYELSEGFGLINHGATLDDDSIMAGLALWIGPQRQ